MNKKVTGNSSSLPIGIGMGVGLALLVTLIGSATAAWMISTDKIEEETIGYSVMVILILSSFLGSWIAVLKTKRLRLQVSFITGGIYYLLLLAITALFFGGQYQGMGITLMLVLVGCAITIMIGLRGQKMKKASHRRKAFC